MKNLSAGLAAHLQSGVTTLCTCWRIERADGVVFGFTDHDRTITFGGVSHEPATGLDATDAVAHAGLQVGGLEVTGAFSSARITEADLQSGRYDNARVEAWLVNWATPDERHRIRIGSIGDVRREGASFTAEIRSLSHALDQERGRIFRGTCDANVGDGRCKVDLSGPAWTASAVVVATDGSRNIDALVPGDRPTGLFDAGSLLFTTGANAGRRAQVLRHLRDAAGDHLQLWHPMTEPAAPGDGFSITAGCDKRFETCLGRFNNVVNFRGFPHMPGNDFALSYPSADEPNTGGRLRD